MAKLTYFNGRGRGEAVRLSLALAGIPFTEELITEKEQFSRLKNDEKLLFNQVPLLEIDGRQIIQSSTIVRYIGRKAGLFGKNEDEMVLIDQLYDGCTDFIEPSIKIGFLDAEPILEAAKANIFPRYLPRFEKVLASNGTGYLVGDKATIADVRLLEGLLVYSDYLGEEFMKDYPAVQKFFSTMKSLEQIAAYLAGPQRKRKNSQSRVDQVKKILGW